MFPVVVRSNASPNSWLLLGVVVSDGAFLPAGPVLVTSVHGDVVAWSASWMVLTWPICRVSTACAIVASRGESVLLLWLAVPEGEECVAVKAQVMLFSPAVVIEVRVPLLVAGDWLVFLLLSFGTPPCSSASSRVRLSAILVISPSANGVSMCPFIVAMSCRPPPRTTVSCGFC